MGLVREDLLFGANMVTSLTTGPGAGYTSRIITSPDGDIAEDRIVTAAGGYTATAALNSAAPWVMQLVAFRGTYSAPNAPAAPTNLTANLTTMNPPTVTLAWSDNSANESGFILQRATDAAFTLNLTTVNLGANTTSYADSGLAVGTRYWYRVRATGTGGLSGWSSGADITPRIAFARTDTSSVIVTLRSPGYNSTNVLVRSGSRWRRTRRPCSFQMPPPGASG